MRDVPVGKTHLIDAGFEDPDAGQARAVNGGIILQIVGGQPSGSQILIGLEEHLLCGAEAVVKGPLRGNKDRFAASVFDEAVDVLEKAEDFEELMIDGDLGEKSILEPPKCGNGWGWRFWHNL